ncbi:DNA-3-methyladenine glycosylase [Vallitalea longa]|uniref:Putative 3-methyladenine DNA glycosylase n=1 Tax=Vallitalea longa TaxID=2936439 RepID=A0A9W6DDZ3_9FIRM|nr:DNA-3-methyladenine glycosylase [Vallitalea longa]GKX27827.1 DNA-3-methyladenine glycosylase [Vallitalea longa]
MNRLSRDFYERDTLVVAQELLGKNLVFLDNHKDEIIVKITDVEAYKGINDKACHTYGGKRTPRTEVMWGEAGHIYIYIIYGMYYCLNIVTESINDPCAVLIRGVVPVKNITKMSLNRYNKAYEELNNYQIKNFSNGPGKLCKALGLDLTHNGMDLLSPQLYIYDDGKHDNIDIKKSKRINIDYAEEAADYLWRFYID